MKIFVLNGQTEGRTDGRIEGRAKTISPLPFPRSVGMIKKISPP